MPINVNAITERQKLKIASGLLSYEYIQNHFLINDNDFKDVFTEFYLSSQAKMRRDENRTPFFDKLSNCNPNMNPVDLMLELYEELAIGKYEFSFATKLLHTVNTTSPIYDSKVREYLKNEENVDFWLYYRAPRNNDEKVSFIRHDWELLLNWYFNFINSPRSNEWIDWFNDQFPAYSNISNIKKIDFIIFACN